VQKILLNDKGGGPVKMNWNGTDAVLQNSSSEDEDNFSNYQPSNFMIRSYSDTDFFGNTHRQALGTGTYSEEHTLASKQHPGILAGIKSSGFDRYFEIDLKEIRNKVDS